MRNQLMTKEVENKLRKYPYLSQDEKGLEAEVIVKYFNPYGVGTWIITEAEWDEASKDWIMYGYCELGRGYEFGSVSFNELKSLRVKPWGLPIEREVYTKKRKVKDLISEDDLM